MAHRACNVKQALRQILMAGTAYNMGVQLSLEIDRENEGRWIAEALELPGAISYGQTHDEAISNTERPASAVIADHSELPSSALNVPFQVRRPLPQAQ